MAEALELVPDSVLDGAEREYVTRVLNDPNSVIIQMSKDVAEEFVRQLFIMARDENANLQLAASAIARIDAAFKRHR